MTHAENVERIALKLWMKPAGWHLAGEPGSAERWEACKREARDMLADHRQWTEEPDWWTEGPREGEA